MNVFKRFAKYLIPYWKHIAGTLICTGIFVLFSAAAYWLAGSFLQVLFNGEVISSDFVSDESLNSKLKLITSWLVSGESHFSTLFKTSIAIVLAFLGKNLFSYLSLYYVSFVEQRVIKDLRDELFNRFLMQDLSFFHDRRRGHLMSTLLNDVQQLNQALNKSFTKIIRDPVNALVLFILLLTVSVKLTLAALIIIPVFGWIILVLGKYIKIYSVRVQEAMARVTSHLQETLAGVRVVKAFASEDFESSRFNNVSGDQYLNSIKRERLKRLVIPINEFIGILIFCGILYVGGEQVLVNKNIGSDDFIRFLVLLFGLLTPIMSMSNLVASIRMAEASGERVFSLMDTRPALNEKTNAKPIDNFENSIEFKNVSFAYNSNDQEVLKNLNLSIKPGDKLAVVGKSGSGKSTFLNLLPRFYDVSNGSIEVDEKNVEDLIIADLRGLFGIVTQNIVLFHDTIAANIAYGVASATREQISEASVKAYADDFIRSFPEGYDTIVGEQGSLLSGGQRQRISIARAFIRNPQIVIMDEATSALDPESEEAVSAAIEKLKSGRTIIMVTHRLAAVREFDRVMVLDQGQIIDTGTHDELLNRCEVYRTLAKQQKLLN